MNRIKKLVNYFFTGYSFLASKKVIAVLELALFIALLDVSTGYQEELKRKETEMMTLTEDKNIKVYQNNSDSSIPETAMNSLVKCYKEKLEEKDYTEEIKKYIESLENLYKENGEHFSFLYQDIYSGFTISYNEDSPIFTASSIKAPAMIYLYEEASKGKIDLKEKLTYTPNFYHSGSGILQTKPQNTSYEVGELIKYAVIESDNIAYAMLMNRFGRENALNFWKEKNTSYIFTLDTIWGVTCTKDASIYMNELYKFYQENDTYGKELMGYFKSATWKLITDKDGKFNTANKGGWSGVAIHDIAIVYDKNPYILAIMSNTGESNYPYLFNNTSKLVGNLHNEYWKQKEKKCSSIKLY